MNLLKILKKHNLWTMGDKKGKRAVLRKIDLHGAKLKEVDLREADLRLINLAGADLREACLCCADLAGANLTGANLAGADLTGASLAGANLKGANLEKTCLWDTDLRNVNFNEANLEGAFLWEADLRWIKLKDANLKDANFDFSCLPLWCGSLSANFDDKQIIQFLYHTIKAGLQSNNTSDEVKNELIKLKDLANKFHRVGERGVELLKNKDNLKEKEDEK